MNNLVEYYRNSITCEGLTERYHVIGRTLILCKFCGYSSCLSEDVFVCFGFRRAISWYCDHQSFNFLISVYDLIKHWLIMLLTIWNLWTTMNYWLLSWIMNYSNNNTLGVVVVKIFRMYTNIIGGCILLTGFLQTTQGSYRGEGG